jgi:hypothetical protein
MQDLSAFMLENVQHLRFLRFTGQQVAFLPMYICNQSTAGSGSAMFRSNG